MSGINGTSFLEMKSDLEQIVADITNSSVSSVTSEFIEMVSIVSSRGHGDERRKRSNENGALINISITPTDKANEKKVLDIINDTSTFYSNMNARLQNLSISTVNVISISQIQRLAGNFDRFRYLI